MSSYQAIKHATRTTQFDLADKKYTMKDNSFTQVEDLEKLNNLVRSFQPSIVLGRISHWMDIFF